MSLANEQMVQCPSCLKPVPLKLMQSTHLDGDCPGQSSCPDPIAVSDVLVNTTEADKRRKNKPLSDPGDFLCEARWAKRKAIATSAQSLLSPGLRDLGKTRRRSAIADDKALDAILNNTIDLSALELLKLMVSQEIELPPEPFAYVLFEILRTEASLAMATACYVTAIELLHMDPLVWIPLDIQCDRFWQILTQIGQVDPSSRTNDATAFRKSLMFARVFILAFHLDIRQRKLEGLDCRDAILRKQIEIEAAKKKIPLNIFIEELNQVYFLTQIAVADDTSAQIPKRYRVEALALAEAFQRMMNNCFPDH